jgi:putative oxidoreductase
VASLAEVASHSRERRYIKGMLKHLALLVYSSMLFVGGWQQAHEPGGRAERARSSGLPVNNEFVQASGWAMIAAAAGLQLQPLRRLSALGVALQLLPITYVGHRFWEMEEGPQRVQNKIHFFKNLSMIGSALYIAATAESD